MWMNEEFGNNIGSIIEFKILHIKTLLVCPLFYLYGSTYFLVGNFKGMLNLFFLRIIRF